MYIYIERERGRCVYVYIYIYTYMYVYTHTIIHIYIHIYVYILTSIMYAYIRTSHRGRKAPEARRRNRPRHDAYAMTNTLILTYHANADVTATSKL